MCIRMGVVINVEPKLGGCNEEVTDYLCTCSTSATYIMHAIFLTIT